MNELVNGEVRQSASAWSKALKGSNGRITPEVVDRVASQGPQEIPQLCRRAERFLESEETNANEAALILLALGQILSRRNTSLPARTDRLWAVALDPTTTIDSSLLPRFENLLVRLPPGRAENIVLSITPPVMLCHLTPSPRVAQRVVTSATHERDETLAQAYLHALDSLGGLAVPWAVRICRAPFPLRKTVLGWVLARRPIRWAPMLVPLLQSQESDIRGMVDRALRSWDLPALAILR